MESPSVRPKDPASAPIVFMRFRPAWAYIEGIRSFSRFFCETTYKHRDLADRAQMVIQEILENAVKYSSAGDLSELELEISSDGDNLKIAIASRPDPRHLDNLRTELEYLRQLDPEAAYVAAFARAANEPEEPARLGLARMRYEGKFELHLNEESGGRVRVTAMGRL